MAEDSASIQGGHNTSGAEDVAVIAEHGVLSQGGDNASDASGMNLSLGGDVDDVGLQSLPKISLSLGSPSSFKVSM